MPQILRYDKSESVSTKLDPLEDVLCWIRGLRSTGLTKNILKEVHGIRGTRNVERRSIAISAHAEAAAGLLEQGFSGPIETSFLPLFYGLLNLSKIYIVCSNQFSLLAKISHHGASPKPRRGSPSRNFLKDTVVIYPDSKGAIPIFYKTITGINLLKENRIKLYEIYPFIQDISYEYSQLHDTKFPLQKCELKSIKDDVEGHKILLTLKNAQPNPRNSNHSGCNQFLKEFNRIENNKYETEVIKGNFEEVEKQLKSEIKRFLLYERVGLEGITTFLPISGKRVLLSEEFPILLAFFHLSNIVRYNPEMLLQLKKSPEWGMIQTLRRHGAFRFMMLFWSYIQKKSFAIYNL